MTEKKDQDKPLVEDQTKKRILTFLPDAISQALKSYYTFMQQDSPDEAKAFSAHHSACKVAIAHIELLIKLARWADIREDDEGTNSVLKNHQVVLSAMLNEAQEELQSYKDKQEGAIKSKKGKKKKKKTTKK
jgi:hypothetical protein